MRGRGVQVGGTRPVAMVAITRTQRAAVIEPLPLGDDLRLPRQDLVVGLPSIGLVKFWVSRTAFEV